MNLEDWDYAAVADRLKQTLKFVSGRSIDAKSEVLGFTTAALYSYTAAKNKFPLEFIIKLRELTNVNLDWLLTGEGEQFGCNGICEQRPVVDPDYFVLVRDSVDDFLCSDGDVVSLGAAQYLDLIVCAYNGVINRMGSLGFDKAFAGIVPLLKDKLSSIKEIGQLQVVSDPRLVEGVIDTDLFSEIRMLVEFFLDDRLKGDSVDRFRFVPLVVAAYNRLVSLEGSSSEEVFKAFAEIVPWLDEIFNDMDKSRQLQLRYERELKEEAKEMDDLVGKALKLIDQKLEDFAKANNLAPPKSEK